LSEPPQTLTELMARASARRFLEAPPAEDLGFADGVAFPFLAIVGQSEMKLALLLALVNETVGGVLLIGPRGTGKTTAARGLIDLLPEVPRSLCPYGCLPEDIETGGQDAVCPDCAARFGRGELLTYPDRVRLIELPLNAALEDVVGGIDQRAAIHQRMRLSRGILARADRNLLYVDEVNLLQDDVVDAILDAAAQGSYAVHRGPVTASFRSRFVLLGSMNPEEGRLRPQIMDRFGLRVVVRGLPAAQDRLEAYRRSVAFRRGPRAVFNTYLPATELARQELEQARLLLSQATLSKEAGQFGLEMIGSLGIDSLRAEITLFEGARAYAVADGRTEASPADVAAIAPMALRLRRSDFIRDYMSSQGDEEAEINELIGKLSPAPASKKSKKSPGRKRPPRGKN
jgi:magnesium chelatase subunit I